MKILFLICSLKEKIWNKLDDRYAEMRSKPTEGSKECLFYFELECHSTKQAYMIIYSLIQGKSHFQ